MVNAPRLVLFTTAASCLYLGLAVAGWGGAGAFFSYPALVAVAITLFALAAAAAFTRGNLTSGVREDRGNRWVIGAFGVIGLISAYVPALTDRLDFWTLDGEALRWFGALLCAGGGALRIWPVFVLGRRFSGLVAIQPGHQLVTTGIYGVIRHPSYLGILVTGLGWALAFRSGVGLLLAAAILPPLFARIDAEERLLRAHFGKDYEDYCARVSRFIPSVY